MAEGIGALAVKISADVSGFVGALDRADKQVEKFSNKIDKRLLQPMAKVGAAAAAAGAGLYVFTRQVTDMLDELAKASQRVGVSVESLSGLKYAAGLAGVGMDQLSTGLKQLSKNMADMQAGTGEARMAFQALGLDVTDSTGKLKPTDAMLLQIADKFAGMQDGANKTALAMKIFGKAGADLIPFLNEGAAGIDKLRAEAARLGVVFSTEAAKKAEEFNDNVDRLLNAARGLQVHMAGPFVDAMNSAAKAMLEAKNQGQGFFATIHTGMQALFKLPDAIKWDKDFYEALEARARAEKKLQQAVRVMNTPGSSEVGARMRNQAIDELAQINAEVERLRAIEKMMKGTELFGKPEKTEDQKKKDAPGMVNPADEAARAKLAIEQWEWWAGEEARIMSEAAQLTDDFRRIEREREKKQQDDLIQMKIDAYDYDQQLQYERGQEELRIAEDQKRRLAEMGYKHQKMDLDAAKTFFGSMVGLMNTNSKKMFEIGKTAAIAETIINTYSAAMGAYKALAGIPIIGPYLGAAAAAAAIATGMSQVQQIRSQTFQGGGGAAAGAFAANPATGQPVGTPGGNVGGAGGGGSGTTTVINLQGEGGIGRQQLRGLIEQINESMRDGGRLVLQ